MRNLLLYVLFLCSGAAGLTYELVWTRELTFVFGATAYAITTVLVTFLAGLALGSYFAGRWCYRLTQPGRVYGLLEVVIGLYALLIPFLLKAAVPLYRALYAPLADWPLTLALARFCIGGLMLLVPTVCMGATLPVLVRYIALQGRGLGRSVGLLYGISTFGAALGTLGAGFWLISSAGLLHTTWAATAISILIGIAAMNLLQQPAFSSQLSAKARAPSPKPEIAEPAPWVRRAVLIGLAISGLAALVYQVAWTRALILSVGSTPYAFTCILAALLLGLALGSLAVARWVDRARSPARTFGVLELLIGLVAVVMVPILGRIPLVVQSLINHHYANYDALLTWQFLLIVAVTFVPTFLLGAVFPLAIRAVARADEEPGAVTGRAYLAGALGAIAGLLLASLLLIRSNLLGVQNSLILASVLSGLLGVALLAVARPAGAALTRRAALPALAVLLIVAIGLGAGHWDQNIITSAPFMMPGSASSPRDIVYYGEGPDATVSVEHPKDAPLLMTLRVNGQPDASTVMGDMLTQILLGHVPALLHPGARSACLVGLGSGVSLAALACYPSFERLDCTEVSEQVIAAAAAQFAPFTYNVLQRDPRVHVLPADGRNYLLLTDQMYDLIITQPSSPWTAGAANLFTREFFEVARSRLRDDGLLAVGWPGSQSPPADFQTVIRTLFDVFDHVSLWQLSERDFLLVASRRPQHIQYDDFVRRFRLPAVRADLYRISVRWPADVLARYVTSDEPLRQWVAGAPVNTDDNALLEFSAPRHMYDSPAPIAQVLLPLQRPVIDDLLADAALPPGLGTALDDALAARLAPARAQALLTGADTPLASHVAALNIVLEACARCPHNGELYQFAVTSLRNYEAVPEIAKRPEIAPLLARLAQVRPPPPGAPMKGASLLEIAATLRATAQEAAQQGRWSDAANLLLEARDLDPANIDATRPLADALAHAGRSAEAAGLLDELLRRNPDDALAARARAVLAIEAHDHATAVRVLATGMKWGAFKPEDLAGDEALSPLRAEPAFQALLSGSVPASEPAGPGPR